MKPFSGMWWDLKLNSVLSNFGCRLQWAPNWEAIFRECDTFIDVGAHLGETVDRFRAQGYGGNFVCFDANLKMISGLSQRKGVTAIHAALSDVEAPVMFTVRSEDGRSSILTDLHPEHPGYRHTKQIEMRTNRLDSFGIISENIFLKIDTEGNDLAVVRGSFGILDRVRYIMLETAPVPRFVGEPTMGALIEKMRWNGFVPIFFERNLFAKLSERTECEAFDLVFKNTR